MTLGDRGLGGSRQEDSSGRGSSSRTNNASNSPPDYPNDQRLTGSSPHDTHPPESGSTLSIHTQDLTLLPDSHYGYDYRTPRSGLAPSNQWADYSQPDYVQTWPNSQGTNTHTTTNMTGYYPPPQYTIRDASVGDGHHPLPGSSPSYVMQTPAGVTVQPASYQQYDTHYSSDRRTSFSQSHSPTPPQPMTYPPLPSPPRSESSYSYSDPSLLPPGRPASLQAVCQIDGQWHLPHVPSNRSVSNPTPVTDSPPYAESQSPVHFPVPVPFGDPGQAPDPLSLVPSLSLGGASSYQPPPPGSGPSFPEPQLPPQPTPARRNGPTKKKARAERNVSAERAKVIRSPPYPQSGRGMGKKSFPSDGQPVASSSRVTLDSPSPTAKERDAERKRKYRKEHREYLFDRISPLLLPPGSDRETYHSLLIRVIGALDGTPPATVHEPKKSKKKWPPGGRKNAIRGHNEDRAYNAIRELLQGMGWSRATSRLNLLRIVVYVLSRMQGKEVDEELSNLVNEFFDPQDPESH